MRLSICRTDGKTGNYLQDNLRRAQMLSLRLDPQTIFCSGPIVIGVLNPFSILNPDEVCWVEVHSTELEMKRSLPPSIEQVRKLAGRDEYEAVLERQWPRWRNNAKSEPGDLLEALVQLCFRGGSELYLHVTGYVASKRLTDLIFDTPAISVASEPDGMLYVNPKCIVRARVYHSMTEVTYPEGLWCAEADEL